MKEAFIVTAKRTPIGGFLGVLSNFSATELGAIAIAEAYKVAKIEATEIGAVYFGNVLSANLGQAPAKQAAKAAGIPDEVDSTTINKVCSSGLKAVSIGAQQIQLGLEDIIIAGGMESMSNAPHYMNLRKRLKLGNYEFVDGLLKDGLTDVYSNFHMGRAAELCADEYKLTREQQDEFALASYERAANAFKSGKFRDEIVPVKLKAGTAEVMLQDEDVSKIIPEKVSKLKPAFLHNGTITAANASGLNDGAAALLLMSEYGLKRHGLKPIARIISYADASQAPEWFTTSPARAVLKALQQAKLTIHDVDYFEINEAYAAVILANQQILNINKKHTNVYGGAVAMGHPLGASGARILCTLTSILTQEGGRYGVAAICNGGGGATAMVIEKI
ncbi:MAG: acetyl-CoA C-acyltransferase [Bacteroidota bacterium]